MDDFDLTQYQGKWYEQGFHDWTQFKEVYDTTLDIKVTPQGPLPPEGWVDDFGVKAPSPGRSPLAWDKSPVANGAHYFMSGRVSKDDPVGVLREKGFGVEFPNYIVDVKKDAEGTGYSEAIQFQCLEVGGVRVFEGINLMSRNEVMTPEEKSGMEERVEQAGLGKYGGTGEQVHWNERRMEREGNVEGVWQDFWEKIGVGKLLELLTESIEDGGRS